MTIAIVSLTYGVFRVVRGDARFLAPTWFAGAVIGIGMINVTSGGTAIPRAIAAALPGLFVLVGGALATLGSALTGHWSWTRALERHGSHRPCGAVAHDPFHGKGRIGSDGRASGVDLVRHEGGFLAARELDPWVPALSADEVALVGDKQSRQPAEVRDRLIRDGTRPCFAALTKFVEVNGTVLVLGNSHPSRCR